MTVRIIGIETRRFRACCVFSTVQLRIMHIRMDRRKNIINTALVTTAISSYSIVLYFCECLPRFLPLCCSVEWETGKQSTRLLDVPNGKESRLTITSLAILTRTNKMAKIAGRYLGMY